MSSLSGTTPSMNSQLSSNAIFHRNSVPIQQLDWASICRSVNDGIVRKGVELVLGMENGLSDGLRDECTHQVFIPQYGSIGSLSMISALAIGVHLSFCKLEESLSESSSCSFLPVNGHMPLSSNNVEGNPPPHEANLLSLPNDEIKALLYRRRQKYLLQLGAIIHNDMGDRNIGAILRNADVFNLETTVILNRKKFSRRGALGVHKITNVVYSKALESADCQKALDGFEVWLLYNYYPYLHVYPPFGNIQKFHPPFLKTDDFNFLHWMKSEHVLNQDHPLIQHFPHLIGNEVYLDDQASLSSAVTEVYRKKQKGIVVAIPEEGASPHPSLAALATRVIFIRHPSKIPGNLQRGLNGALATSIVFERIRTAIDSINLNTGKRYILDDANEFLLHFSLSFIFFSSHLQKIYFGRTTLSFLMQSSDDAPKLLPMSDTPVHLERNTTVRSEILHVVLEWMTKQGYTASAQVLREEASAQHRGEHLVRKMITSMNRSIEEHNWEAANKCLKRLQQFVCGDESIAQFGVSLAYLTRVLPFLLVQQQFLEMIGSDDDGVRAYTFFLKSVKPYQFIIEQEHFKKLTYLLLCKSVGEAGHLYPEYRAWSPGIGCAQLISFINKTIGDTLVRSAYIANNPEVPYNSLLMKPLESYIEEAFSYHIIKYKYPKIATDVGITTVSSLASPLFEQLPPIEPLTAVDVASLLSKPGAERKAMALTCCLPLLEKARIIVGSSTGDVLVLPTDILDDAKKNDSSVAYTVLCQLSDAVRGLCFQSDTLFCWGGHRAVLTDVPSSANSLITNSGPAKERPLQFMHFEIDIYCGCLFPMGTVVATGHSDGTVAMWDAASGDRLYQNNFTTSPILSLIVNRCGTVYYSGSQDGAIRAVDTVTGILLFSLVSPIPMELSALSLSPSSACLVAAYRGGTLRLWDTVSGQEFPQRFSTTENTKRRAPLSFGNLDSHIFCGTDNGNILFWSSVNTQKHLRTCDSSVQSFPGSFYNSGGMQHPTKVLNLHRAPINDVKIAGNLLFSCGDDGYLCICSSQHNYLKMMMNFIDINYHCSSIFHPCLFICLNIIVVSKGCCRCIKMNDEDEFLDVKGDLNKLRAQSRALKSSSDRQRAQMENLTTQIQRADERSSKLHADLAYTQQQLEYVIASLEREHDIVADHAERLRLFADESSRNRDRRNASSASRSFVLLVSGWLYTPAMHLAKGVYSLVSPLVYTIHSLSLFNSDILYRYSHSSDEDPCARDNRKDDLFMLLQMGKLDPPSVVKKDVHKCGPLFIFNFSCFLEQHTNKMILSSSTESLWLKKGVEDLEDACILFGTVCVLSILVLSFAAVIIILVRRISVQFSSSSLSKDERREMKSVLRSFGVSHLAIVMDGNRRFARSAQSRGLDIDFINKTCGSIFREPLEQVLPPNNAEVLRRLNLLKKAIKFTPLDGHRVGAEKLESLVLQCIDADIPMLTVYAFSIENWNRVSHEVNVLMAILLEVLYRFDKFCQENGVFLRIISTDVTLFPRSLTEMMKIVEQKTRIISPRKITLNLCVSYSGQTEILQACRSLLSRSREQIAFNPLYPTMDDLRREMLRSLTQRENEEEDRNIFLENTVEPQLIIRTGGDHRISNFLLFECAYSELFFTSKRWPEFGEEDLMRTEHTEHPQEQSIYDLQLKFRMFYCSSESFFFVSLWVAFFVYRKDFKYSTRLSGKGGMNKVLFATTRILAPSVVCGDLACIDKVCMPCRDDSDCYPSAIYTELIALLCAFLVCSIAVLAGVGGGGILVPMFTGLMSVPMTSAVGLSQATICGQSTLNVGLLVFKKFPDPKWSRPLINYQYLSLLLPLGLCGTLIGGVLSKLCPDLVRLILLFVLLSAVLVKTFFKIKKQYAADKAQKNAEDEHQNEEEHAHDPDAPEAEPNGHENSVSHEPSPSHSSSPSSDVPTRSDQSQFPVLEILICILSFIICLLFQILMHYSSCDGTDYWVYFSCSLGGLIGSFVFARVRLQILHNKVPERITFSWTTASTTYYLAIAIFAGAAAAMLGLGGGIVLGFVVYDVLTPEEGSATSGTATFFMAFSAAIPQIVSGVLPLDYGAVLFVVGIASTSLGQFVFMRYIRAHGLRFLIVAALAAIVLGSLLTLGGYGIYNVINDLNNGSNPFAPGKLCAAQ
eukprot:gene7099-5034_t